MTAKQRIRDAFDRAGHRVADDVLEELTEHAEHVLQSCRAAGTPESAGWKEVDREIAGWLQDIPRHRHSRPSAPAPPPADRGWAAAFTRDLVYAARVLRRRPAPALVGIATIALGMTAVTLMVSVCWGVLKPLPWRDAERLVRIYESRKGGTNRFGQFGPLVTNVTYRAWQEHPNTIDAIGGWGDGEATLNGSGPAERLRRASVTPSLFDVLQSKPILGRAFAPSDAVPGAAPVIILSHELWEERFGGRREVIGQRLLLDGNPNTIVGVMPPGFAFPNHEVRAWVPMFVPDLFDKKNGGRLKLFSAMARLRPGVTPTQASAEAAARADAVPKAGIVGKAIFGSDGPAEVTLVPALEDETKEVRPALVVLLVAAGLLLAASAANIANVQLARAVARRRELAVRAALGATTGQIARQLVIESGLIGLGGGAAGLALAALVYRVLPSVLPADFPRLAEIHLTGGTALVALVAASVAGTIAGVLPAIHVRRTALVGALSEDALAPVGMSLRSAAARLRLIPMAAQVMVATVLLVGASLLGRTFVEMLAADRGFQVGHVLTVEIPFPPSATLARRTEVLDAVLDRVAGLPAVVHAGYTSILPLTDSESMQAFDMPNPRKGGEKLTVRTALRVVSPGYLPALGVRLLRGRQFTAADTATSQRVAIVNETFARAYLGDDPLAARLPKDQEGHETAIVGVVNDVRPDAATGSPEMFVPVPQYQDVPGGDPIVTIRTAGDPVNLAPVLRGIVRDVDATLALGSIMSMEDRLLERLARPRLYSTVLAAFAGLTLLVAAVGLFGVLSYSVMQRSREMAVRAALGASPARLLRLVVVQGLTMTALGLAAGLVSAYALARSMSGLLVGVTASDPASYAAAAALLLVASVVACAVPAIRAARLDPMAALKRS
jgi:predicted permease